MQALTLKSYIDKYYNGKQRAFASASGVAPQQVTQWLYKDFIVIDHQMYSARRALLLSTKNPQKTQLLSCLNRN